VFNFAVADWQTYFVGVWAWLVHNAGRCLSAFKILKDIAAKISDDILEVAKNGGKHSGFYQQYINKSKKEIEKGIRSLQKQIDEHLEKILHPQRHILNFNQLDLRQQDALINKKWPMDIQRQLEQKKILEEILKTK
jgi:hypothetical protein